MSKRIILEGRSFGYFKVLRYVRNHQSHSMYWCRCECGNEKEVSGTYLRLGKTKSCGCHCGDRSREIKRKLREEFPLYDNLKNVHRGIIGRCLEPGFNSYKNYGARGISVCKEWINIRGFMAWAHRSGYVPGLTIDRTDNNGNYCPENCRWVTHLVNCNNQRRTRKFLVNGKEYTYRDIANKTGLPYSVVQQRIKKRRHTAEELLTGANKHGPFSESL